MCIPSVLKEFNSQAKGTVKVGEEFPVSYRVEGSPPNGLIEVCCTPPYSVSPPQIVVTELDRTRTIAINGPSGRAKVVVSGKLGETHGFVQDVE